VSLVAALLVACGAALQASAGRWLVAKWVGWPSSLERAEDIGRFLVAGGPVSALVSSTVGPLSLFGLGLIERSAMLSSMGTWWIGDCIGLLVATPLLLSFMIKDDVWRNRRRTYAVPMVALFCGVVAFFFVSKEIDEEKMAAEFGVSAERFVERLDVSVHEHLKALQAVQAFFGSGVSTTEAQFQQFAEGLMRDTPGIVALSWNPLVTQADRPLFEQRHARSPVESFDITERNSKGALVRAAERPSYVVVQWIYPTTGNEKAIGYDVASNPIRLQAIEKASATGEFAATSKIKLVQDNREQVGVLVFAPVFIKLSPEHPKKLHGFAVAVFRLTSIIEATTADVPRPGWDLVVHRGHSLPAGESWIFTTGANPMNAHEAQNLLSRVQKLEQRNFPPVWNANISFADQTWHFVAGLTNKRAGALRPLHAWSVLVGGLFLAGVLGAFLLIITGRVAAAESGRVRLAEELLQQSNKAQKRLEKEKAALRERSEELLRANTALTRFTYAASHDLKEPLRTIRSYSEILADEIEQDCSQNCRVSIDRIEQGAKVLDERVHALFEYAGLGEQDVPMEDVQLEAIVQQATEALAKRIDDSNGNVIVEELGVVRGNAALLQDVFENLLSNAVKFTDGSRPRVVVSSVWQQDGVTVIVADNGVGISSELRERAFDLFRQVHHGRFEGSGLGLSLSRQIIERHGGRIWIEDNEPTGTKACVWFPGRRDQEVASEAAGES
jgi:signal transduction histidine kinase